MHNNNAKTFVHMSLSPHFATRQTCYHQLGSVNNATNYHHDTTMQAGRLHTIPAFVYACIYIARCINRSNHILNAQIAPFEILEFRYLRSVDWSLHDAPWPSRNKQFILLSCYFESAPLPLSACTEYNNSILQWNQRLTCSRKLTKSSCTCILLQAHASQIVIDSIYRQTRILRIVERLTFKQTWNCFMFPLWIY